MIRSDYLDRADPARLDWARWALVALAGSVPLGSALSNVLTAVVLILLFCAGGFRSHWGVIRRNPFALASIMLLGALIVGIFWSTGERDEAIRVTEKHARVLLVVFAVVLAVPRQWRNRAIAAWLLSMAITLLLSYLHSVWAFPLARATREAAIGDHYIFKHHITQNVMMSVFAGACLALAYRAYAVGKTKLAAAGVVIAALAGLNVLFFVAGRTGYLTLLVALFLPPLLLFRGRVRWYALGVITAAAASVVFFSAAPKERMHTAIEEAQAHDGTQKTSIGMRVEFAQKSLQLISERPIAGFGTGSYSREYCRVASTPLWCEVGHYNPHNQFLFFGVQLGLIGVLVLIGWIACAAYVLLRVDPAERTVGFVLLATFLIHSMLDSPLYINTEGVWYPLGLGLLAAGYVPASKRLTSALTRSTEGHSG